MLGVKTIDQWRKFCQGRETVCIRYDEDEIYRMNCIGLFPIEKKNVTKAWKDFVSWKFKQQGVEVLRHFHDYEATSDVDYWGLVPEREDSVLVLVKRITAIIGVNARRINAIEDNTNSGDKHQPDILGGGDGSDNNGSQIQESVQSSDPGTGGSEDKAP